MASKKKKEEIDTSTIKETNSKKTMVNKFPVGSIVYVSKDVVADLEGFSLSISQYKKEAYTVEAYDENTGVYTLRHLKLLLHLKEEDLVAPDANAHDVLARNQF